MNFSEKDLKCAAKAVDESMLDNLPPPEAPSPQLLEKLDTLTLNEYLRISYRERIMQL